MGEPFATVEDLEDRWRALTPDEASKATALIADASAMLRAEMPDIDGRIASTVLDPAIPTQIVARMVKRSMQSPSGAEGVSSVQDTAGPFTYGMSFANPGGDIYMTKADRKLLGIRRQRAYMVDMLPAEDEAGS